MSGMFAFPDGVFMFRGTQLGWKIADTHVTLPTMEGCDNVSPLMHVLKCKLNPPHVPSSTENGQIRSFSASEEFASYPGQLGEMPVSNESGELHTILSVYSDGWAAIEAEGTSTVDTSGADESDR